MNALETEAKTVSAAAAPKLGFDPISIVTILLPFLMNCFKRTEGGDMKAFLEDHYDEHTDTFDAHLVDRCRRNARRAARKAGSRKLSVAELDEITIASLRRGLDADESDVAACMAACPEGDE